MTTVARPPSLWRNRAYVSLWGGQVVSTLGAQISGTAMPLLVLAMTGSPADAGLVGAAGTLPFLVAHLPAGPLVDRWNRRTVMLTGELVAAAAVGSVPVAMWCGVLSVVHLAVVAFVQGMCLVFFGLAERAALPAIVPAALLPAAIAQNEVRTRGAALAGPPLGGLLLGLGRSVPFVVDAVSYVAAAVALLFVRGDLRPARAAAPEPWGRATLTGLRWVRRQPFVRAAVLLIAASNLVFQALGLVLVVLAQHRGASPAGIGTMLGIASGGGLVGAFAADRFRRLLGPRRVIVGVNWVWAALLPLFLLASGPLQIGAILAACAFTGAVWNVVVLSYATVLVPGELLGRVTGVAMTVSWGVLPPASLGAGYLVAAAGPAGSVWVLTALMLAVAVTATASRAVRQAPPLPGG